MNKITKLIILMVVAFGMSSAVNAQVKFGIKAGANMSKAYTDKRFFSSDNRVGFLVGPMLDVKIPVLGLGFDLAAQYSNRKARIEAEYGSSFNTTTATMHHVEVPLNVKWTFGNDKGFSVYAATGPQIAWNLDGKSLKDALKMSEYKMNASVFSWNVGAGFTIARHVRIGYTYNIAVGNTAEIKDKSKKELEDLVDANMKSNTHQMFFTYFF